MDAKKDDKRDKEVYVNVDNEGATKRGDQRSQCQKKWIQKKWMQRKRMQKNWMPK